MKYIRVIALLMFVAFCARTARSVPARPGLRIYHDPTGRQYELRLIGDEFFHQFIDADGNAYTRDSEGYFMPVEKQESIRLRKVAAMNRVCRRIPAHSSSKAATRAGGEENFSQVKHIGDVRIPVILVQYKDLRFRDADPVATFQWFFNTDATSAAKYFRDQSEGQFRPQFDIFGPVTLPKARYQYGGNTIEGGDRGIGEMVAQACLQSDKNIDFSQYDYNGDSECDVVIILYAGDGEASSNAYNAADAIWPCQWDLETSDYGRSLTLDETKVNMFAVFNELNGENLNKIDGVGTFCHEFSHCLGLPDFYDTQYGPHFGMGNWSIMDHGGYNNSGYTPLGYSAYEKEYMGWYEISEAIPNSDYTLFSHNSPSSPAEGKRAIRLTNPADSDEFYILETRRKRNWDAFMPAEGLLITHFTYDSEAWEMNCVNDFDLQRATIIPADGELELDRYSYYGQTMYFINEENEKTDLWPQPGSTELTDYSPVAAKVNTGGFMSKPILAISRNAEDASVSFRTGDFIPSGVTMTSTGSEEGDIHWMTLDGMLLSSKPTQSGIYLRRIGNKIEKIII